MSRQPLPTVCISSDPGWAVRTYVDDHTLRQLTSSDPIVRDAARKLTWIQMQKGLVVVFTTRHVSKLVGLLDQINWDTLEIQRLPRRANA